MIPTFPFPAKRIRRLRDPSDDAIAQFIDRDCPVVLNGWLDDWPLLRDMRKLADEDARLGHLEGLLGAELLTPYWMAPRIGAVPIGGTKQARLVAGTFRDFARKLRASWRRPRAEHPYLEGTPLERFPELMTHVPAPTNRWDYGPKLWVGGGGHTFGLHYDHYINFICMVSGVKRVSLLPLSVLPDLYPSALDSGLQEAPASCVRLLNPDFRSFPRFRRALAELRVTVLRPGDALVIPPHWWHHVESFGFNVMVNSFVFDLPPQGIRMIDRSLYRGMSIFDELPAGWRERFARSFDLLALGRTAERPFSGAPARRSNLSSRQHKLASHFVWEMLGLCRDLPDRWRAYVGTLSDYFVFQRHGRPLAHFGPKAHTQMIRRLEKASASSAHGARTPMDRHARGREGPARGGPGAS